MVAFVDYRREVNLMNLADGAVNTISTTFSTLVGSLGTDFVNAVPTVAGVGAGIVAVMIGVPLALKFFRRLVG